MSSELKRETARTNGAKSHGPVTPEGKARSAANSRLHGLAATAIVLRDESREHFQLLLADYMDQFQPQTGVEADLVEVMVVARWRLRRLLAIETHLFDLELARHRKEIDKKFVGMEHEDRLAWVFQGVNDNGNSLALLLRYEASINRSYDKALKQLQHFQSNRPPVPPTVAPANPVGSFGNPEPQAPSNREPVPATGAQPSARRSQSSGMRDILRPPQAPGGRSCRSAKSLSKPCGAATLLRDRDQPFLAGTSLITAAPALLTNSSCESVPPEQPIAPTILPCSMSGMPPRDAMIPSNASR
jgi:hypothetical protein